jgi:hypothetical protein
MAVAKRVPVMMTLKMDQRSLPELLAVCGSVPLMVEVKHVRILPPSGAGAVAAGDGMSDTMGAAGGMGAAMTGMTGMGEGSGGGYGAMPTTGQADAFPLDMVVEVYGIIYIYNPPQADSLGIEKVDENTVIEGTALGEGRVDDAGTAEPGPAVTPETTPAPPAVDASGNPAAPTDPAAAPAAVVDPAAPAVAPAVPAVDPAAPVVDPAAPVVDPAAPVVDPAAPVVDPAAGALLFSPHGLGYVLTHTKLGFVFVC